MRRIHRPAGPDVRRMRGRAERRRTGNARRRARRAWGSERPWSPRSPERPGGPGRARQTCCACSPRSPRSAGGKVAFGSPRSARDEGGFGSARGAGGRSRFREPRKREGRRRLRAGDGPSPPGPESRSGALSQKLGTKRRRLGGRRFLCSKELSCSKTCMPRFPRWTPIWPA